MGRERVAALTAAFVLLCGRAHAEETRFSDRFFRGTSSGEVPTAKVALVGALYVAAVASVSIGVASLVRSGQKGDDAESFKQGQPRGFCNDLASPACASYRSLLDEQSAARSTGWLLLGSGGVLAVGGALMAELWKNEHVPTPAVALGPGSLTLGLGGKF